MHIAFQKAFESNTKFTCVYKEEIMDYRVTAKQVVDLLGGETNIL